MSSELTIISNKVYDKLKKELDDLKSELKTKSPDEIIQSAYELVAKEDIIMAFECEPFQHSQDSMPASKK